jgi:hypothetical protein
MKLKREFSGSVSEADAVARARKIMKLSGYTEIDAMHQYAFTRGRALGFLTCRPRSFRSTLRLWVVDQGPQNCKFVAEHEVSTLFEEPHGTAKQFFEGEMDDLEKGILTNEPPTADRRRQNKLVGTAQFVYILCSLGISFGVARIFGPHTSALGAIAYSLSFLALLYCSPLLKFGLVDTKVHRPKGAKLVSDEPEEVPVAPFKRPKASAR